MFHKALWFQHVKQSKYILGAFWLAALISAFQLFEHAGNVEANLQYYKERGDQPYPYFFGAAFDLVSVIQLILCIGLAAFLVGFGRTNQSLDYMYAMPVKRQSIYMSKWLVGIAHITGASTLALALQLAIVHSTVLHVYLADGLFWMYYAHQLAVLWGTFSFALWVGLIGGSFISQAALSAICLLLPYGLFGLLKEFVSLHFFAAGLTDLRDGWLFSRSANLWFEHLSFPIKLINIRQMFSLAADQHQGMPADYITELRAVYYGTGAFIVPLLVTAGSFLAMLRMSGASRNENNGKLLLNVRLRPYLIVGFIVCAFLLGGQIGEGMLGNHYYGDPISHYRQNLLTFYAAAVISAGIAYVLIRRMAGVGGKGRTSSDA